MNFTPRPPLPAVTPLERALAAESPRLNPRPAPAVSLAICAAAVVLFAALLSLSFLRQNLTAWSIGIAYILYDTGLLLFTAVQIAHLREAAAAPAPVRRPTLGVIVAARNEAAVLGPTIAHLAGQSDPPDLIIIADDGSDDDTPAVMARLYGLTPPPSGAISPPAGTVRWLRLPHGGKARALNHTLQLIETDLVLTVDADTLLDDGAIAAMRAAFAREPELVAATGVLTPVCGPDLTGRFFQWFQGYEYIRNFLSRYAWMQVDALLLISGAFAAFRRDALMTVGGFDPDCLVEDYELIHRLHRHAVDSGRDWRVRVIGEARARTDAPATLPAFLRQRRRWFCGFLQTQFWNRDMIGNPRFGRLGTAMMVVKTFDTLQPVFGLTAFVLLLCFAAIGGLKLAAPILMVMLAKIAVDLVFHLWSLGVYARWTGRGRTRLRPAILAVCLEPFTFQLVRHAGAVWGWFGFLAGRDQWGGRHRRTAVLAEAHDRAVEQN